MYREITNSSIEEEMEQINSEILKLEEELLLYDPNFHHEDTLLRHQRLIGRTWYFTNSYTVLAQILPLKCKLKGYCQKKLLPIPK